MELRQFTFRSEESLASSIPLPAADWRSLPRARLEINIVVDAELMRAQGSKSRFSSHEANAYHCPKTDMPFTIIVIPLSFAIK